MSSERSPYKELGLSSRHTVVQTARRRVRLPSFGNSRDSGLPVFGHYFEPLAAASPNNTGANLRRADAMLCRRCDKPRFAVDGKRCRGKKP